MLVPKTAIRSVVFIGDVDADNVFTPRATGFLVLVDEWDRERFHFRYLVTAEHVVSGMLTKDMKMFCRVNLKGGGVTNIPLTGHWWHWPSENESDLPTDVAVMPFALGSDVDHDYIPRTSLTATSPHLGEEVFLMGLFKRHYGKQRNLPIVRIANIAALPGEPVWTKACGYVEAYLAEVRSISGLSGSPLFKNVAPPRPPEPPRSVSVTIGRGVPEDRIFPGPISVPAWSSGTFEADNEEHGRWLAGERLSHEEINWQNWQFVGLISGHFDVKDFTEVDVAESDASEDEAKLNTGIAIIIPAKKVLETLLQPDLKKERLGVIQKAREENGATADVDFSEAGAEAAIPIEPEADNPAHKEDFMRLLGAASKAKPQAD